MARKVFVSYSHRLDQQAADDFQKIFADERDVFINKSSREDIGDLKAPTIKARLSSLIKNSSVTVVLIGQETGGRSWVDWEINHSLRKSDGNARNGLLGVKITNKTHWISDRLSNNIPNMGLIIDWPRDYRTLANAIEEAYKAAKTGVLNLNRSPRKRNSSKQKLT